MENTAGEFCGLTTPSLLSRGTRPGIKRSTQKFMAWQRPGQNLCVRMIQSCLVIAAIKLGFPNRDGLEKSLRQGDDKTKS